MILSTVCFGVLTLFFMVATQASADEPAGSRTCMDKEKGTCDLEGLFSFCYLNKETGDYNCDDEKFCASKSETLRSKAQAAGCFGKKCCCKTKTKNRETGETEFVNVTGTQKCLRHMVTDKLTSDESECADAYCYTIRYKSAGLTGGYMAGCHSMLKNYLHPGSSDKPVVAQDPQHYKFMKAIAGGEDTTCAKIIKNEAERLGVEEDKVEQACHQIDTVDDENNELSGKFCCCTGSEKCNENLWPLSGDIGNMVPEFGSGIPGISYNMGILISGITVLLLFFRF